MLQKISLILFLGLMTLPIQYLHAETNLCAALFKPSHWQARPAAEQAKPGEGQVDYTIKNPATRITITIIRTTQELAALYNQGFEIFRLLQKNTDLVTAKFRTLLQEYSPHQPFHASKRHQYAQTSKQIATTILEVRSELAKDESSNYEARVQAQKQIESIDQYIEQTKLAIFEGENLAYRLEIITQEVSKLSADRIGVHTSLVKVAISDVQVIKNHLRDIEALKNDLEFVIRTNGTEKIESPITRRFYTVDTQVAETSRAVEEIQEQPVPIRSKTGPGTLRPTSSDDATVRFVPTRSTTGPGTTRPISSDQDVNTPTNIRSKTGQGTTRVTAVVPHENPGKGVTRTVYVAPAPTRGKVVLNPTVTHLTLNLDHNGLPIGKVLRILEDWTRDNTTGVATYAPHGDTILVTLSGFKTAKLEKDFKDDLIAEFSDKNAEVEVDARTNIELPVLPKNAVWGPAPTIIRAGTSVPTHRLSLSIKYPRSGIKDFYREISPADMLDRLSTWARGKSYGNHIEFKHSGSSSNPIEVIIKAEDAKIEEIKKDLREYFNALNPVFR